MQHYIGKITQGYAALSEADAHHLLNVKRAEKGEKIEISDEGKTYLCVVESISPLKVAVLEEREDDRELRGEVAIAFGLLKADHNELIVQKGTELGVSKFLPFTSSRTIVKPSGKEDPKLLRLRKIAFESTKQCRRANVPEVEGYSRYQEILNLDYDYRFFAFEGEAIHGLPLFNALNQIEDFEGKKILVLIGPEGGFSDKEAEEAVNAGFAPVSLGKRILRAETAAIYSATLLSAFLEKGE